MSRKKHKKQHEIQQGALNHPPEIKKAVENPFYDGQHGIGIPVEERAQDDHWLENLWHYFLFTMYFVLGFAICMAIGAGILFMLYKAVLKSAL